MTSNTPISLQSGHPISARLDILPVTGVHRQIFFAIGAGLLVDGFDVYLAAGVAGALVKQEYASLSDIAWLMSSTFIALAIGGVVAGILADKFGRRRVLQSTLLVSLIGSICCAFAQDMNQLIVWRCFTALGLGGETVLCYAMLSEFLPPDKRGRGLALLGLLANLGMPLALGVGYFILPYPEGWRWMLALPAIAAIPVLWLRRSLPESPRWLVEQGRLEAADAIVSRVERSAQGIRRPPRPPESKEMPEPAGPGGSQAIRILVGSSINIAMMSAVFGFISWLPTFFASEGFDITDSLMFSGIMALGSPVGVVLALLITDRIERKYGIVFGSFGVVAIGVLYAGAGSEVMVVSLGFLIVTGIYVIGTFGMTTYVPELFATNVRMRSVAICSTAGRAVAVGMPFAIAPIFAQFGQSGVVAVISIILIVNALLVALLGARTKARPLEDV